MKITRLWTSVTKGMALVGLLSAGGIAVASAAPITITFNPSAAGLGPQGAFQANNYTGADYATATINNSTGAFTESGVLSLTQFQLNGVPVNSGVTSSYGLFKTFTATGVLPGFTAGNPPPPVNGSFTSVSYNFVGDPGNDDVIVNNVLTDPSHNDVLLGTGALDHGVNSVGITGAGTPVADVLLTLMQNSAGMKFFQSPPNVAFQEDAFTNNTQEFTFTNNGSTTTLTITAGGLSGTFSLGKAIPEPASMALLGAGLVGLGLIRRRKS